jgi:hypothetical protein
MRGGFDDQLFFRKTNRYTILSDKRNQLARHCSVGTFATLATFAMDISVANFANLQKWNVCYTDCDPRNPRNGYIGCVGCVSCGGAKVEYMLIGCDLRNPRNGYIGCEGCEGSKVEYLLTWRDLCNPCNGYIRCNGCKGAKVEYFFFLPSNMPTISLAVSSSFKTAARVLSLMPASRMKAIRSSLNLSPCS